MEKTIIINQPFGAGDIIFCLSIANDFISKGYTVIWPMKEVYVPLGKHLPGITVIDEQLINVDLERPEEYQSNGARVIPLRYAANILKLTVKDCMKAKYMILGKDWNDWKNNVQIKRDSNAEFALYKELGLEPDEKFNLISEYFGTGGERCSSIFVDNGLKNVYMVFKDGYTLFDWLYVIEQATNIHVIASSNVYLFELLPKLNADEIHLYLRAGIEKNHDNYSYLLKTHNYILHTETMPVLASSLKQIAQGNTAGVQVNSPAVRGNSNNVYFPMDTSAGNVMRSYFPALFCSDYFSNCDSFRKLVDVVSKDLPAEIEAMFKNAKNIFFINVFTDYRSVDIISYTNIRSTLLKKASGRCHFISINAKEYNVAENKGSYFEANLNIVLSPNFYEKFEQDIATRLMTYQHTKSYFMK